MNRMDLKTIVSIIVPIYQVEPYLKRCLESLVNQSMKEIEIILVDDCGTDNSILICKEYQARDPRIRIVHHKENKGLAEARNTGLDTAVGEYAMFVDADDYLELDACESAYLYSKTENYDAVLYDNYKDGWPKGDKVNLRHCDRKAYIGRQVMKELFPEVLGTCPENRLDQTVGCAPWMMLIRRNIAVSIRFISERKYIYEDLVFVIRVLPHLQSVGILHKPLYHYVCNQESLTHKPDPGKIQKIKKMYDYLIANYSDLKKGNNLIRLKRSMLGYIRISMMQIIKSGCSLSMLRQIVNDNFITVILEGYPISKLPTRQKIFAYCLRRRAIICLVLVVKLHDML